MNIEELIEKCREIVAKWPMAMTAIEAELLEAQAEFTAIAGQEFVDFEAAGVARARLETAERVYDMVTAFPENPVAVLQHLL